MCEATIWDISLWVGAQLTVRDLAELKEGGEFAIGEEARAFYGTRTRTDPRLAALLTRLNDPKNSSVQTRRHVGHSALRSALRYIVKAHDRYPDRGLIAAIEQYQIDCTATA